MKFTDTKPAKQSGFAPAFPKIMEESNFPISLISQLSPLTAFCAQTGLDPPPEANATIGNVREPAGVVTITLADLHVGKVTLRRVRVCPTLAARRHWSGSATIPELWQMNLSRLALFATDCLPPLPIRR
jgi:hypothetical protein